MANSLITINQPNYNSPTIKPSLSIPSNINVGNNSNINSAISSLTNLSAYFDFSQVSSITLVSNKITQAIDLSGNGQTAVQATDANRPTYAIAVQNSLNVASFTVSQYLTLLNSTPNTPQCSVAVLFKTPASLAATYYLFEVFGISGMNAYVIGTDNMDFPAGQIQVDAGQNNVATSISTINLSTSTWYNIVMVWDSTITIGEVRLKIYLNGIDVTNPISPNGSGNTVGTSPIYMGYPDAVNTLPGYFAEFVSTNGAISSAQAATLNTYWIGKWNI